MVFSDVVVNVLRSCAAVVLCAAVSGCAAGYYWQAASGQFRVSQAAVPVSRLLQSPQQDPELARRLEAALDILDFAHAELGLPDNGSYRRYLDTGGQPLVWNVYAAPEFSLEPRTWCFPVAGCVAYRGYFAAQAARRYAAGLAEQGYDVRVLGVSAYSTLGYLKDPLLDTMLSGSEAQLAAILFHELAHQLLYLPGDTAFNEGFASLVEQEGLRRWLARRGAAASPHQPPASAMHVKAAEVKQLLRDYRRQLRCLYASDQPESVLRERKQALLQQLEADYAALMAGLDQLPYAVLFDEPLNNAALAAVAIYDDYLPAFRALLNRCAQALPCFYAAAEELAAQPATERQQYLQNLLATGRPETGRKEAIVPDSTMAYSACKAESADGA